MADRAPRRPAIRVWQSAAATQPPATHDAPQMRVAQVSPTRWRLTISIPSRDPLTQLPVTRVISLGAFSTRRDANNAARALATLTHLDYLRRTA